MRKESIATHRRKRGGKVLAVLPIHYPRELLTAMNVLAVEVWGPPGKPANVQAARIQTYVCPIVRNAVAFLGGLGTDRVDGLLFPSTCDSIQGLATLLPDLGGWDGPTLRFAHPIGERRPSAQRFLKEELVRLSHELAELTGQSLDLDRLRWAIGLHAEIDAARAELSDRRSHLDMSDPDLYALLRRGEYLWPEDHLSQLKEALERIRETPVQGGIPLMITGLVPEPMGLIEVLDQSGAFLVCDDYAGIGRRIIRRPHEPDADPWDELIERYYAAPPCPTRNMDLDRRVAYLHGLYERRQAAGLIIHAMKFCEPELFDVPSIRRWFSAKNRPVLYLETELEDSLSAQNVTRLEAFVEMVASSRRAA